MTSASEARKVWTPYQATAIRPRMMAGMLAPLTPKTARLMTGYGTPVSWLGFATRLQKMLTITMPANRATSTCQLASPRAKRLPAVT
ncbi:hypothetical protein D9M72_477150 [compost metagenome]